MSIRSLLTAVTLLVSCLESAAIVTVPAGLNPGDQYRLVYVTTSITTALSTDMSYYNGVVQSDVALSAELSALAPISGWTVIGSSFPVSANTNTSTLPGTDGSGISIFNLGGEILATSYADLWDGSLINSVSFDRSGSIASSNVWTGTGADGEAFSSTSLGNGGALGLVRIGVPSSTSATWINNGGDNIGDLRPLYAISPILTVAAIPEPATSALLLGLAGLIAVWYRRR
jgi:hypothetical protein